MQTHWFYSKLVPKKELNTAREILRWWELKRLLFNAFNFSAAVVGMISVYAAAPHFINFFLLPFIIGYGLLINLIYLAFWLPFLVIKKTWPQAQLTFFISGIFIFVLIFSSLITLAGFLGLTLFSIS